MNRNDIIRMAQEAGWKDLRNYDSEMNEFLVMGDFKDLERFAQMVADKEREFCRAAMRQPITQENEQHQTWCDSLTKQLLSMPAQPALCNCKLSQNPVAKNEGGRIKWVVDNWPQNCLLYTFPPKRL